MLMKLKSYMIALTIGLAIFGAYTGTVLAEVSASQAQTEQQVRDYFADIPVMIEIARCESKFRQFTDAGNVLRGGYDSQMVGIFQIYEEVHTAQANALGYDITTVEGNLAYARYLYEESGTEPWNAARSCWEDTIPVEPEAVISTTTETVSNAELQEKIALLKQIISLLQMLLELQQVR